LAEIVDKGLKKIGITLSKPALAITCIVCGVIVIVAPQLLSVVVGIFLLLQGILLLTEHLELQKQQPALSTPKQ